jgi:hypothetical protein
MFTMIFKCISGVFASVSDTCFKYCIYFILYVANIASGCFKSRLGVIHVMRVGSGRGRARFGDTSDVWSGTGPLLERSCISLMLMGRSLAHYAGTVRW